MKHRCCLFVSVLGLAYAAPARADVSSWAYVGGGASQIEQRGLERHIDTTLSLETGLGTSPHRAVVFGGMFKLLALFDNGADLGLSARLASRGFVTGRFGLALDAGPYQRLWGDGSTGGQAALVLGAPWGLMLSLGGGYGTNDARQIGASLGFDFARLTVYRLSGENWLPNPHPAYRPKE
ncbi:MAG TPA: hypothetical protein VJN18_31315 [Polyangiaceae bacterium]|nr:hypothetical protein [Polyangiaceae bacterium]